MAGIKLILFFFILPILSIGQTIHVEKGKVLYHGKLHTKNVSKEDLYNKASHLLLEKVNANKDSLQQTKEKKEMATTGQRRLPSPHHLIKTLHYTVRLKTEEDKIDYEIGHVYLKLRERGGETKFIPAEVILKEMDSSGKQAELAEKQLNEIDMYIQQVIAELKNAVAG